MTEGVHNSSNLDLSYAYLFSEPVFALAMAIKPSIPFKNDIK